MFLNFKPAEMLNTLEFIKEKSDLKRWNSFHHKLNCISNDRKVL